MTSADLQRLLARVPPFAGHPLDDPTAAGGLTAERLPSLTNCTFRLDWRGESVVLRLPGAGTGRFIDRAGEARNARLAEAAGIAPPVLYADTASGVMLTRYVAGGRALDAACLRDPAVVRACAALLKRLHGIAEPFAGRMELYGKMAEYLGLAERCGVAGVAGIRDWLARAGAVRAVLEARREAAVPCHIDPTPRNFVVAPDAGGGPRVFLVDWEYAAMADALWDLADLAAEAELDADGQAMLLDAYDGGLDAGRLAHLALYRMMLDLLAAAWGLVQVGHGNGDLRAYAQDRLDRFRAAFAGPDVARWLAAAARAR